MQESDVFLLPSRNEGLPKVTLEAAACGLPCIVFRDYETPSVDDGVTGFQVNTSEEMMEKLGLLLENAQLRESMGNAGRKVAERFEWDSVAKLWQDAYLRIASTRA
jgi:glycosyltransferase involved in cell wall biosynthesis